MVIAWYDRLVTNVIRDVRKLDCAALCHGIAEQPRQAAESGRGVGHAVKAAFKEWNLVICFQLARHVKQSFGAHHHVRFGSMHGLHIVKTCVTG